MARTVSPWLIFSIAFSAGVIATLVQFSVPPVLPLLQARFATPYAETGLLMSLFALATLLSAVPGGFVVQRYGVRTVCRIGWTRHNVRRRLVLLFGPGLHWVSDRPRRLRRRVWVRLRCSALDNRILRTTRYDEHGDGNLVDLGSFREFCDVSGGSEPGRARDICFTASFTVERVGARLHRVRSVHSTSAADSGTQIRRSARRIT